MLETARSSQRSGYRLPFYNGFSHEERVATNPVQRDALRQGLIKRPEYCSICGFGDPADLFGRGYIFMHLEDYTRPLEFLPVCKRCHAVLHARFEKSEPWQALVREHGRPGLWFMKLSMNPDSQMRPFQETYPMGITRSSQQAR